MKIKQLTKKAKDLLRGIYNTGKALAITSPLWGSALVPAIAGAEPINSVKKVRENVDSAFFNKLRYKVCSDDSYLARFGLVMPAGPYNVDVLATDSNGDRSLSVGLLGERVGLEATLSQGSTQITAEATPGAGFLAKAGGNSNGVYTIGLEANHQIGDFTGKAGVTVTNEDGERETSGNVLGMLYRKAGKTMFFPYVGASAKLDTELKGYKFVGLVVIQEGNPVSLGLGIGKGGKLADFGGDYTTNAEIRYSF